MTNGSTQNMKVLTVVSKLLVLMEFLLLSISVLFGMLPNVTNSEFILQYEFKARGIKKRPVEITVSVDGVKVVLQRKKVSINIIELCICFLHFNESMNINEFQ